MINDLKRCLAGFWKGLTSEMRSEYEIFQRIEEEMEFYPTIPKAIRWFKELEGMELHFLSNNWKSPMQMRRLVEAKGCIYDLIDALEHGRQIPHVAYYRYPLQLLREELKRTRL